MQDAEKKDVKKWIRDEETKVARSFRKLSEDTDRFWSRFDLLKEQGQAVLDADDPCIPPYILIAIRDGDRRTIKSFINRRGADPRLTTKVKEILNG